MYSTDEQIKSLEVNRQPKKCIYLTFDLFVGILCKNR